MSIKLEDINPVAFSEILTYLDVSDLKNLKLTSTRLSKKTSIDKRVGTLYITLSETTIKDTLPEKCTSLKISLRLSQKFVVKNVEEVVSWFQRHAYRLVSLSADLETICHLVDGGAKFETLTKLTIFNNIHHSDTSMVTSTTEVNEKLRSVLVQQSDLQILKFIGLDMSQIHFLPTSLHLTELSFDSCRNNEGMNKILTHCASSLSRLQILTWKAKEMNLKDVLSDNIKYPKLEALIIIGDENQFDQSFSFSSSTIYSLIHLPETLNRFCTRLKTLVLCNMNIVNLTDLNCELLALTEVFIESCTSAAEGVVSLISKARMLKKLTVISPDEFDFSAANTELPALKELVLSSQLFQSVKGLDQLISCCSSTLTKLALREVELSVICSDLPSLKFLDLDCLCAEMELNLLVHNCWQSLHTLEVVENGGDLDFKSAKGLPGLPSLKHLRISWAEESLSVSNLNFLLDKCSLSLKTLTMKARFFRFGTLCQDFEHLEEVVLNNYEGGHHVINQLITRSSRSLTILEVKSWESLDFSGLVVPNGLPKLERIDISVDKRKVLRGIETITPLTLTGISTLLNLCRQSIQRLSLSADVISDMSHMNFHFPNLISRSIKERETQNSALRP